MNTNEDALCDLTFSSNSDCPPLGMIFILWISTTRERDKCCIVLTQDHVRWLSLIQWLQNDVFILKWHVLWGMYLWARIEARGKWQLNWHTLYYFIMPKKFQLPLYDSDLTSSSFCPGKYSVASTWGNFIILKLSYKKLNSKLQGIPSKLNILMMSIFLLQGWFCMNTGTDGTEIVEPWWLVKTAEPSKLDYLWSMWNTILKLHSRINDRLFKVEGTLEAISNSISCLFQKSLFQNGWHIGIRPLLHLFQWKESSLT